LKAGISDGTCPINTMQRQSVASVNKSAQTEYLLAINGAWLDTATRPDSPGTLYV
jgi:hypothetical protein